MSKRLPIVLVDGVPATVTRPHRTGDKMCGICGSDTRVLGVEDYERVYQEICVICILEDDRITIQK